MAEKRKSPGRPPGRNYPQDVRVRLTDDLRSRLVMLTKQSGASLSETVREALELKFATDLKQ
jgi:predicted HicB family RNase H-like nuclease